MKVGDRWRLETVAGELVAELEVDDIDFPWLGAAVHPGPAFAAHRELLASEAAASEAEDWDTADRLYEEIRARLVLRYPEGGVVPEFLLHVDGESAHWRWNDTAFDEDGARED